jgi:hypothetical protein
LEHLLGEFFAEDAFFALGADLSGGYGNSELILFVVELLYLLAQIRNMRLLLGGKTSARVFSDLELRAS